MRENVYCQSRTRTGPAGIEGAVAADYDAHLEELFIHFHHNPELSFLEHDTAARSPILKRLKAA